MSRDYLNQHRPIFLTQVIFAADIKENLKDYIITDWSAEEQPAKTVFSLTMEKKTKDKITKAVLAFDTDGEIWFGKKLIKDQEG